jgi:hypothetical protein
VYARIIIEIGLLLNLKPFVVDKVKMPTTRYPLNETILIEGKKIIIQQIEISPLKLAIHQ